jgi:hypothetical protein
VEIKNNVIQFCTLTTDCSLYISIYLVRHVCSWPSTRLHTVAAVDNECHSHVIPQTSEIHRKGTEKRETRYLQRHCYKTASAVTSEHSGENCLKTSSNKEFSSNYYANFITDSVRIMRLECLWSTDSRKGHRSRVRSNCPLFIFVSKSFGCECHCFRDVFMRTGDPFSRMVALKSKRKYMSVALCSDTRESYWYFVTVFKYTLKIYFVLI